jgi:hypothetical protein
MSETDLTAWLDGTKNKVHDFKSYLTAVEMARMVAFIQKGMADHSDYINADGKAKGMYNTAKRSSIQSVKSVMAKTEKP